MLKKLWKYTLCGGWHWVTVHPCHPFFGSAAPLKQGKQLHVLEVDLNMETLGGMGWKMKVLNGSIAQKSLWMSFNSELNHTVFHFPFLPRRGWMSSSLSKKQSLGQKKNAERIWKIIPTGFNLIKTEWIPREKINTTLLNKVLPWIELHGMALRHKKPFVKSFLLSGRH